MPYRATTPEIGRVQARVGARARHTPDAPELEDDRRELRALRLEEHVRRVVDQAPPLTQEQRDRIAAVLRPTTPAATA